MVFHYSLLIASVKLYMTCYLHVRSRFILMNSLVGTMIVVGVGNIGVSKLKNT